MSESNRLEVGGGENVSLAKLTAEQQKALALLVEGKSIAEAARASGVSRPTVYKWMKQDVHFRAMMNQWRGELEEWRAGTVVDGRGQGIRCAGERF